MATKKQQSVSIFHGWWVVLVAGIGLLSAPILPVTFGMFLKPLSQEFGWSRTQISLAFSLSTLAAAGTVPFIGRLVDQWGARRVIMPAAVLFGLALLSLAFLSAQLWHLYAVYLFLGVVGSGKGPVPYTKVIARGLVQPGARRVCGECAGGGGPNESPGTLPGLGGGRSARCHHSRCWSLKEERQTAAKDCSTVWQGTCLT